MTSRHTHRVAAVPFDVCKRRCLFTRIPRLRLRLRRRRLCHRYSAEQLLEFRAEGLVPRGIINRVTAAVAELPTIQLKTERQESGNAGIRASCRDLESLDFGFGVVGGRGKSKTESRTTIFTLFFPASRIRPDPFEFRTVTQRRVPFNCSYFHRVPRAKNPRQIGKVHEDYVRLFQQTRPRAHHIHVVPGRKEFFFFLNRVLDYLYLK